MMTMFNMMGTYVKGFFKKEEGQGMVEYALIIALIAIVVILAVTFLGEQIQAIFNSIGDALGLAAGE